MPPQPSSRTRVRLLLVEDDPDHAWLLTDQLRIGGFDLKTLRVETAESMRVALREPWDAIIADNRLPNFSGLDALAIYRETGLDIPFLVVSGTVGEERAAEFMKAGAHDFILKENTGRLIPALQRELRQAANRRRERLGQQRYQQIVETSSEGIYMVDEHSRLTFANHRLSEMLGRSNFELMGRSIFRFVRAQDRRLAAMTWRSPGPVDLCMLRRDGSECWVMATVTPLLDEKGQRSGVLGMVRDISKRKQLEEQLLALEVDKKRFCCQLLNTVTRGKFHLVEEGEVPRQGQLLLELDLSQRDSFSELRQAVYRVASAEGMAEERVGDLVVAVGEAAGNAIKHAEVGRARVRKTRDRLQVEVSDQGPGIRAEDLPASILQPGFSTKVSLGMGYSLMLELVDRIWLASQPGGTTVQLEKGILAPPDPLLSLFDRYD